VLVSYSKASSGTAMEIHHAKTIAQKLGVVVWNPSTCPILSPFVRYYRHVVVPSYDATLDYIRTWRQQRRRRITTRHQWANCAPEHYRNWERVGNSVSPNIFLSFFAFYAEEQCVTLIVIDYT